MHTTSPSLLLRLRDPEQQEAWSRFVRTYSPMVYAWAKRIGLQPADAADLVQDVFATLLKKLPEFDYDNHRRFRGWLWTITKNKWLDRRRVRVLRLDKEKPVEEILAPAESDFDEEDFRLHFVRALIPTMQNDFQPNTWQAFWAQVVEGKTAPSVAKELGMTVAAAYKAKARVLARLQEELGDLADNVE